MAIISNRNLYRRFQSICGMIAPVLFSFTVILGGALRPGYSHLSETMSELFSPGSPNKLLLDSLHSAYALLLICFGFGILAFVRKGSSTNMLGITGVVLYIMMGVLSLLSATLFPQDPWGSPPTTLGQMHIIIHGLISLLTIISMILLGTWFTRSGGNTWYGIYSIVTVVVVVVAAIFLIQYMGSPIMGLVERIAGFIGFQWTFVTALVIFKDQGVKAG